MMKRIVYIFGILIILLMAIMYTGCKLDSIYLDAIQMKMHGDIGTCLVVYDANGATSGEIPADDNYYLADWLVTVLENSGNLVKDTFTFIGWNTAADGSGTNYVPGDTFEMGPADVTLFANWSLNPTFTVTYNGNGHTAGAVPADSIAYEVGEVVTILAKETDCLKTGHTYLSWNTAADGSGISYAAGDTFEMGIENVTLYAHWSINSYTVTYDANEAGTGSPPSTVTGDPPSAPVSYDFGSEITVLGNSGNFYVDNIIVYNGWNTEADGTGAGYTQNDTFILGDNDVTLYVLWTNLPTYTVTYNADGGTGAPTDSTNYLPGDTVTLPGEGSLDKGDYTFGGWNTAPDGAGTDYSPGPNYVMGSANVTFWAKWLSNQPEIEKTTSISNLTSISAQSGGDISTTGGPLLIEKGVCWSTSTGPTVGSNDGITNDIAQGTGSGPFTSNMSSLTPGQKYYVRAYAINSEGTVYGNEISFTTYKLPTVTTYSVINIESDEARGRGNVTDDGGTTVTERGICWAQEPTTPDINDSKKASGSGEGSFYADMTGLSHSTTYNVRAYATNSVGTSYGAVVQFEAKYQLGDEGPGDGYVFYDKGFYSSGWRYLEASSGHLADNCLWQASQTNIGALTDYDYSDADETAAVKVRPLGEGKENTNIIISAIGTGSTYAAQLCEAYAGGGETDWYLPSVSELVKMDQVLHDDLSKGGFRWEAYWSSNEDSSGLAWQVWFTSYTANVASKTYWNTSNPKNVRACRRF